VPTPRVPRRRIHRNRGSRKGSAVPAGLEHWHRKAGTESPGCPAEPTALSCQGPAAWNWPGSAARPEAAPSAPSCPVLLQRIRGKEIAGSERARRIVLGEGEFPEVPSGGELSEVLGLPFERQQPIVDEHHPDVGRGEAPPLRPTPHGRGEGGMDSFPQGPRPRARWRGVPGSCRGRESCRVDRLVFSSCIVVYVLGLPLGILAGYRRS
jgi:hypothetical protein